MKILFLTHHWKENTHHAEHSGYQQIVISAAKENECTVVTCGNLNKVQMEHGIKVYYIKPFIKKEYFFTKRFAISKFASSIEKDYDVVHALYSDCGFYQKHNNLISTYHISSSLSKEMSLTDKLFLKLKYFVIERKVFKKSKKIILMSNNLINGIEQYGNKALFIPHGINTDYWNPQQYFSNSPENDYVLSVGNNGVDKELLYATIAQNPGIKFVVVGLRDFNCKQINLVQYSGISDSKLKELYYNCRLFIRPMHFATANNSVLEALSMGKPVLIATPDGKYDYFDKNMNFVKTVKNMNFINELSKFYNLIRPNSISQDQNIIRNSAINNFDWKVIFEKTYKLYE